MKKLFRNVAIIALSIVAISCSKDENKPAQQTITEIAVANPNLSTLVEAIQRTGLVEPSSTEQFTVFAPTNTAFQNYLTDRGLTSLDDLSDEELTQILLNHVITGAVQSTQLTTGYIETNATFGGTETGNPINMYVSTASGVRLNGVSSVVTPNIIASNGVIHVVDAVIGLPSVVTFAAADPNFSILAGELTAQGLVSTLQSTATPPSPFTVFAPTNAAFAALDAEIPGVVDLLTPAQLTSVLTYHVVAGDNVLSSTLTQGQVVTTFETGTLTVGLTGGAKLTDERNRITNIVKVDVQAANGVIHVLDNVLLPNF